MNLTFLARQIGNAVTTTVGHMDEDRVFFSMQLARRLPRSASKTVGRLLGWIPSTATGAASAWLQGHESRAKAIITSAEERQPSRLLGEIALNLGMLETAGRIAEWLESAAALRSRILWTQGRIDEAIATLPDSKRKRRLVSERTSMSPGWWPASDSHGVARPASRSTTGTAATLHVLTNSLPHTRSGYAYRSHLILTTLRDLGHQVAAATRPSYPVTIGRLSDDSVTTRWRPWMASLTCETYPSGPRPHRRRGLKLKQRGSPTRLANSKSTCSTPLRTTSMDSPLGPQLGCSGCHGSMK